MSLTVAVSAWRGTQDQETRPKPRTTCTHILEHMVKAAEEMFNLSQNSVLGVGPVHKAIYSQHEACHQARRSGSRLSVTMSHDQSETYDF
jgi:hypothetical protein